MKVTLQILVCLFFLCSYCHTHTCIHNDVNHTISVHHVNLPEDLKPPKGRSLQQTYESIRIYTDFSNLNSGSDILDEYIQDQLVSSAVTYLQETLQVVRFPVPLTVPMGQACAGLYPPDELASNGVAADLIILVTSEYNPNASYVAYSSPCSISQFDSRPIYGMLSINTAYLQIASPPDLSSNLYTVIHEITHVLGFSPDLYPYYINATTGETLQGHIGTKIVNGLTTNYINVEPLTTKVREYYNCSDAVGAYLENEGATGSVGSHWERRIFFNEYMTANAIIDSRITEFTLALLEGSGWYQVNYNMTEPFEWGKNQSCQFLDGPCMDSATIEPNFPQFCTPLASEGCSFTSRSVAICGSTSQINVNPILPSSENYWGNDTIVVDQFSDNCPYFIGFSNADCEDPTNKVTAYLTEEFYGLGSRCFTGTLAPTGFFQPNLVAFCFSTICQLNDDNITYTLNISVGGNTIQCIQEEIINIPNLEGYLQCPDPNDFCRTSNPTYCRLGCSGRGECVNNTCQCPEGWGGADCALRAYVDGCQRCANETSRTSCFGDICWCNSNTSTCSDPTLIGTGDGSFVDPSVAFSFTSSLDQAGERMSLVFSFIIFVVLSLLY